MWQIPYNLYRYRSRASLSLKTSGNCDGESDQPVDCDLSLYNTALRTQMLLLDYKQFKAARTIQKMFRGWAVRNAIEKRHKAALTIQRMWKTCAAKRKLQSVAQDRVQEAVLVLFETSSIKIQAVFRGWWSRKHINNSLRHKIIQLDVLEDILGYVARQLHTAMRTGHLPGVSTLSDEECLTKVANLIATMSYRMSNYIVDQKFKISRAHLRKNQEEYKNSYLYTWAPFEGTDCESQSDWGIAFKYYDHAEQAMAQSFVQAKRTVEKHCVGLNQKVLKKKKPSKVLSDKQKQFCEQMLNAVKKWSALKERNSGKSSSLMDMHVQEFIDTVKGYLESFNYLENCHCKSDPTNQAT